MYLPPPLPLHILREFKEPVSTVSVKEEKEEEKEQSDEVNELFEPDPLEEPALDMDADGKNKLIIRWKT